MSMENAMAAAAPIERADYDGLDEDVAQTPKYLTFAVADLAYGIDIGCVTEIVGLQSISPIPDTPAEVRGVINLRGKVIPVMDVRLRFGLEPRAYDNRTCTVVLSVGGVEVGIIVDTVNTTSPTSVTTTR